MSVLDEIISHKRIEVERIKRDRSLGDVRAAALGRSAPPDFIGSLRSAPMGLVAEVKKQSPSAGIIRSPFDPREIARAYASAGAQAVSVLLDEKYFGGGEDDFQEVRSEVEVPLLYKEFVIDPWQVWHAASLGASAVLLIAAVLDRDELMGLLKTCAEARVEPLVEVHEEVDMDRARKAGARLVGINNRDLRSFMVSLETTLKLKDLAPKGCTLISESGIHSAEQVARLKEAGIHAVLVGEHLLRQKDLVAAVRDLMKSVWT